MPVGAETSHGADRYRVDHSASVWPKLLPGALSVIAGSLDVISFFGLGGLFAAHITGNLVILAAHFAGGEVAKPAQLLSLPVFMLGVGLTKLLTRGLEAVRLDTSRPLLGLQFLLLLGAFVICAARGSRLDPDAPATIVAGMSGIAAMAVQTTFAQISLRGVATTIAMTSNVAHFMIDACTLLFPRDAQELANAHDRLRRTWPVIVGFAAGGCLGAVGEAAIGLWSLAIPAGLALAVLALSYRGGSDAR
jgi:uncharacterized membrane protein YoaK (UPF0700 family)